MRGGVDTVRHVTRLLSMKKFPPIRKASHCAVGGDGERGGRMSFSKF